jgi:hypothetical protein
MIIKMIIKMIINLKIYLKSLFIVIIKLCCPLSVALVKAKEEGTNKFKNAYFLPFIFSKLSPNITPET